MNSGGLDSQTQALALRFVGPSQQQRTSASLLTMEVGFIAVRDGEGPIMIAVLTSIILVRFWTSPLGPRRYQERVALQFQLQS
jgi:hypothetical protein